MDKQFFTEEVKAAERSLYRVARSYMPSDEDAADAVQEALCRAWAKRNTLREPRYFRTWLTRVLINACKDELRRRKRAQPTYDMPEAEAVAAMGGLDDLREALEALNVKYRVPVVLYYLDGYTVAEIAGMLSLPQGTVKNRLFRAKQRLRARLQGKEVFDDEA